ncbi:hypothetical protein E3J79_02545, partial [Candidatus Dependentiae bacterium]
MKFTKDLWKMVLSFLILLGMSSIVKTAEPNFKLKNNLGWDVWYGVASTEGALNRQAFEKGLEKLHLGSEAIRSVDNVKKRVFLLIMGSHDASRGIIYELPQDKTLWIVIEDVRGNITLSSQKRPWIIRGSKQRELWAKNVKNVEIRQKPFYLQSIFRYRA